MIVYKIYHRDYKNPTLTKYTDTYTGEFLCTEVTTVYNNGTCTEVKAHRTILGGKRYLTSKL